MTPATLDTPHRPVLKPEVQATIDTAVERLVAEFQPEQIWLFGSYAWGEPDEESDLDFVVVVSDSGQNPLKRAQRAHHCLGDLSMANDVLVKTRAEFDRFVNVVSSLTHKVTQEGRLLYGGRHALERGASTPALRPARVAIGGTAENRGRRSQSEAKRDWIRLALGKATSELRAVRLIAGTADGPLDTAVFHCHQAAENAVKGYLGFADKPLQETHDIEQLVREAVTIEPSFAAIMSDAFLVKPYLDKFRYPSQNDPMEPTRAEFDEAFAAAQHIYDFVLSLLPPETHPS